MVGTHRGRCRKGHNEENYQYIILGDGSHITCVDIAHSGYLWGISMVRDEMLTLMQEANRSLLSMDIKGKDYIPVNERIKAFRYIYPQGQIRTEIIGLADGVCTMKAEAYDEEGRLLSTGHAQEKETSSFINKTSYIENCETSAVK